MIARLWSHPELRHIAELVRRSAGLRISESQREVAEAAIERSMRAAGVSTPSAYLALVERDSRALELLTAELTIGETYFFRDPAQLGLIRERILPELVATKAPTDPIRIWSAGCATGEEAYSLAILAHELGLASRARIVATDISRERLDRARRGRYGAWSFRGMEARLRQKYFRSRGRKEEVDPALRELVEFRHLNLMDAASPAHGLGGFDLILCRNVLIYLEAPMVARLQETLVGALSPEGWLLLGATDPALGALSGHEVVTTEAGLAYRRARGDVAGDARASGPGRPTANRLPRFQVVDRPVEPAVLATAPRARVGRPAEAVAPPSTPRPRRPPEGADAGIEERSLDSAAARRLRVRELANRGRLAEAEALCAAALERHPTDTELLHLHSLLLLESGQSAAAARAARQALYLDPTMAVAHLALGSALVRAGEVAGGRRAFRNAVRLLSALDADEAVPGSGGETAEHLLEMARAQIQLAASGVG